LSKRGRSPFRHSPPAAPSSRAVIEQRISATSYSGPLPTPEQLEKFDQVLPGLADRIMTMAEGHASNRWRNDRLQRVSKILGQCFAFLICMALIGGGFYTITLGHSLIGFGTVAGAVAGIIWAYRRPARQPDAPAPTR
jgi:uncharacterized membrane protein